MLRLVLVSCGFAKRDYRCQAQDMYTSTLFKAARAYAETFGDYWFIISAKHGWLSPYEFIDPYDQTVKGATLDAKLLTKNLVSSGWTDFLNEHRECLSPAVYNGSKLVSPQRVTGLEVTALVGKEYLPLLDKVRNMQLPLEGMQIGQRIQWLQHQVRAAVVVAK